MELRKAVAEDLVELCKIRVAYLKEDYGDIPEEKLQRINEELPGYFTKHLGKELFAYIAFDNGRAVASAFLLVIEKPANPNFVTGKVGEVLNVYTAPEFRKKGIASRLLGQLLEDARALELSFVELSATKMGAPLYRKLGFVETVSNYTEMKFESKR